MSANLWNGLGIPRRRLSVLIGLLLPAMLVAACPGCSTGAPGDGQDEEPAPYFNPVVQGPYQAGYARAEAFDASRSRRIPVDIWYPVSTAASGEAVRYMGLLPGSALLDQPVETEGAPFPLIVFSHGSSGVSIQNYLDCQYLATHGYVVAAPSHLGNTLFTDRPRRHGDMLETRPRDISAVIDWMLADDYGPYIDPDAIGVMGHSFGGYTSLAVAGAEAHPARFNDFCADLGAENDACDVIGTFPDPVESVNFRDDRVRAAIGISPGMYEIWEADGLARVETPVMILSGTADSITPHAREAVRIYAGLPAPKYLVTFDGANHYGFTIVCELAPRLPHFCTDNSFDSDTMQSAVTGLSAAFFGRYLKLNPAYGTLLTPDAMAAFPGVSLQASPSP